MAWGVNDAEPTLNEVEAIPSTAPKAAEEISRALHTWRVKVLNVLLLTAVIAALPILGLLCAEAVRKPALWPATLAFMVMHLFLVGLAVARRLDVRWRAWGFLLVGYAAAVLATARGGLAGEARDEQGRFFEEDRLRESLIANWGQPAEAIRDAILGAVDEFVGDAPQSDDIALAVVVRES